MMDISMMTSSNGNIFRVTGHMCGEFTGHRWIHRTKTSDAEHDVFFDLRQNKRLVKQSWGWWFETLSRPLRRHCNATELLFILNRYVSLYAPLSCDMHCIERIILYIYHYGLNTTHTITQTSLDLRPITIWFVSFITTSINAYIRDIGFCPRSDFRSSHATVTHKIEKQQCLMPENPVFVTMASSLTCLRHITLQMPKPLWRVVVCSMISLQHALFEHDSRNCTTIEM